MAQPQGFVHSKYSNRVCKLEITIYRLKQSSRIRNLWFHKKVKEFRFARIKDESCVYVKTSESVVAFLVLQVDDVLLVENDISML